MSWRWITRIWDSQPFHWAGAIVLGLLDLPYSLYWRTTGGPSVPYWREWQSHRLPKYPLCYVTDDLPIKFSRSDACGAYLATMVVTYVDVNLLTPLLPAELELDPSRIIDGQHPIIYMFGYTQHLRWVWLKQSGFGYLEFAAAIPGLKFRDEANKKGFMGPFTYVAVLYLQQIFPTMMGWMVGYNKKLRRMSTTENEYRIRFRDTDQEIVHATFSPIGSPEKPPKGKYIQHWVNLTMQPQANQLFGTLLFLHYHLDWPGAIIQPVEASVDVTVDDGIPGLTVGHHYWPGLEFGKLAADRAPEGAFRLWAPFELLAPFTRRKLEGWKPPIQAARQVPGCDTIGVTKPNEP